MDVKVHISIMWSAMALHRALPVVVVGGGISGLAAARRLVGLDCARPIRLLEAGGRLGGLLQTRTEQGYLWETAADGFHGTAGGIADLCQRIGLADQILPARQCAEPVQVVHRRALATLPLAVMSGSPTSVRSILRTSLLTCGGKLRIFGERWVAPNVSEDEPCESFFTRRFGRQFYERLVEPVVSAIYSSDPAQLSMQALFPHLREMERQFGSITAAMRRRRLARGGTASANNEDKGAWTLRRGMSSLATALATDLPAGTVELNAPVHQLRLGDDGTWRLEYGAGRTLSAAAVVLATPAHRAAHLLRGINPDAARLLEHISYSSVAVIALGYRRAQIRGPLTSLGFFVPQREPFELRSASFTSLKYEGRAPADAMLIRACLGGDHHSSIISQNDAQLTELAHEELQRLLKIAGGPIFARVQRQMFAIPQYRLGHRALIDAVGRRLADLPGLALAGNAYAGIGVPQCVASGQRAADQIHEYNCSKDASCSACTAPGFLAPQHTQTAHA
jgi:oxygen-dependent protoporphyrinogen oxidase